MATKIEQIHLRKLAVKGKIYEEGGKYYVGQTDGSLKVEHYLGGDLQGTTLRSEVIRVGNYTTDELMSLLDELAEDISDLEDSEDTVNVEVNTVNVIESDTDKIIRLLSQLIEVQQIQNELIKQMF